MAPHVRRTWASRGQTPILRQKTRSHRKISAMGALVSTPRFRKVRFMFRLLPNKNFGARECLAFARQLLANIPGKIILIWDRLLAHRAKIFNLFLTSQSRLEVRFLPPYAPHLNPVETIWSHLKMNKMANYCPHDLEELHSSARSSMYAIRSETRILKNIFKHVPLNFS
jgi:transposase